MHASMAHLQWSASPWRCSRLAAARGSRGLTVAHAKRKGVSKELRELQQLNEASAPAAPDTAVLSAPKTSAAPQATPAPAASVPSVSPALHAPASPVGGSVSSASAGISGGQASSIAGQASTSTDRSSSGSGATTSGSSGSGGNGGGGGVFDNLTLRILASATAIMAVIGVFYSIVFYGASNAVYVFKDQLAAVTRKDFVPYSERRRMEQEVLAKLEADLAGRQRAQGGTGEEAPASSEAASPPGATSRLGAESSDDLLNLLPSKSG